ncbi:MAG: FAD-binding oxidoreductase, partial [Pseudomonadota bacterium]
MPSIEPHIDSHYARHDPEPALRPSLHGRTNADVCVVGGGLAGLTTALELAKRGVSVVVLESRRIGWGASGRNGGFVSGGFAADWDTILKRVPLQHARKLN